MKGAQSKAATTKIDSKLKSKGVGTSKKVKKAAKDPNKPKRAASAFSVFMEALRKQIKIDHPKNKSVALVDKWKSMSNAEKAPFLAIAEESITEYNKNMLAYNQKIAEAGNGEDEYDSDKSKSEVNGDDEEDDNSEEEDEE